MTVSKRMFPRWSLQGANEIVHAICATLYLAAMGTADAKPTPFLTTNAPASRRKNAEHNIAAANPTSTNKGRAVL